MRELQLLLQSPDLRLRLLPGGCLVADLRLLHREVLLRLGHEILEGLLRLVLGGRRLRLEAGKVGEYDVEEADDASACGLHARVRSPSSLRHRLLQLRTRSALEEGRFGMLAVELLQHLRGALHGNLGILGIGYRLRVLSLLLAANRSGLGTLRLKLRHPIAQLCELRSQTLSIRGALL